MCFNIVKNMFVFVLECLEDVDTLGGRIRLLSLIVSVHNFSERCCRFFGSNFSDVARLWRLRRLRNYVVSIWPEISWRIAIFIFEEWSWHFTQVFLSLKLRVSRYFKLRVWLILVDLRETSFWWFVGFLFFVNLSWAKGCLLFFKSSWQEARSWKF